MKQTITLEKVTLELEGSEVVITHLATGAHTRISVASLERWLIRQLRSVF